MSILGSVGQQQRRPAGQRIVLSGVEKSGKTTLAMNAPRALLVPLEVDNVAMSRTRHFVEPSLVLSFGSVLQLCKELLAASQSGQLPYHTIVWDSATALERMIHDAVITSDPTYGKTKVAITMESALGGYGKAYQFANEMFNDFLRFQDQLASYGGVNIILTAHVFAGRVVDPAYGEYDTWDLLLHSPKNQKTYGKREIITQWADMIGFLHEPLFVMKADDKQQLTRGLSANKGRVLAVDRTPGYVAGNRYGITGEIPIPLVGGWNHVAQAIYTASGIDVFNRD